MGTKNKDLASYFDDGYFCEMGNHQELDLDSWSLDSIDIVGEPLSVEENVVFENVGREDLISADASDVPDYEENFELNSFMEKLSKRENMKTASSEMSGDEISSQINDVLGNRHEKVEKAKASKPFSLSKKAKDKLDLYDMEQEILNKVQLIVHDEGLYYFNGCCYTAIRNDFELLELIRSKVSPSAFHMGSLKPIQDLIMFIKTDPLLIPDDYERRLKKARKLVALNNGVLNISSLKLKEYSQKYLLFHKINASWTSQYPKVFMKFLRQSCGYDEEIVKLTTELIGYILSGSNQAKIFAVIGTAPDSGKSTLASLLQKLIGEEFTSSVEPNKLHDRFSLGSSRGKILNMAMDIPKGRLNSAAISKIKAITGQDFISIEEKFMRLENTRSTLRFLFGTNHPISLGPADADDDAFWNRMLVIPFMRSVKPEEKDPYLLDKLWQERDAIASYCLRSYRTVLENGYLFSPCQASENMKASWRRDDISTVSFANFWRDYVEVTGDVQDQIFAQVLYDQYVLYCRDRDVEPIYYPKMKEWIEIHTDPNMCIAKRIHRTGQNPRAGYCGICVRY